MSLRPTHEGGAERLNERVANVGCGISGHCTSWSPPWLRLRVGAIEVVTNG